MQSHPAAIVRLGILAMLAAAGLARAGERPRLVNDGLHDPSNPAIHLLQEASDIIASLPKDTSGTGVNWDEAMEDGLIDPRASILPGSSFKVLNQDIIMPNTGRAPMVLFPHLQHTEWIGCESCHEELFSSKPGIKTVTNMKAILNGESCGICHGAVAFPLTECRRCHSVPRHAK